MPDQSVLDELGIISHDTRTLESAWSQTGRVTAITFVQAGRETLGYTSERDEDGAWADLIDHLRRSKAFHERMDAILLPKERPNV